jgi:hypothetical protein
MSWYVPTGQSTQPSWLLAPMTGPNVPAGQFCVAWASADEAAGAAAGVRGRFGHARRRAERRPRRARPAGASAREAGCGRDLAGGRPPTPPPGTPPSGS